jgi:hypothetical protein
VFHVELRQFPNVARSFNLSEAELHTQVVAPWVAERSLELDDRRWSPEKARLTIYEAARLAPEEIGLGRGWQNVTRSGRDVTAAVLERARGASGGDSAREQFKAELEGLAATGSLSLAQVLSLAAARNPGRRVSEQLALAEQAVWELLHQRRIAIASEGADVPDDGWQPLLLSVETWTRRAPEIVLRPPGP